MNKTMQDTYFNTQASALQYAWNDAVSKGYEIIHNNMLEHVAYGTTNRYSFQLVKGDKVQKKELHISLYRMESGKYELTHYIQ